MFLDNPFLARGSNCFEYSAIILLQPRINRVEEMACPGEMDFGAERSLVLKGDFGRWRRLNLEGRIVCFREKRGTNNSAAFPISLREAPHSYWIDFIDPSG
jgi:hypothetical protein